MPRRFAVHTCLQKKKDLFLKVVYEVQLHCITALITAIIGDYMADSADDF
jgi:hypothetical protein